MNQNVPDNQPQEIDLNQLTKKIGSGFNNLGYFIFNCIQFFFKHGIAIVLLLFLGLSAGYYLKTEQKKYDHKIIVLPNFNSSEYLYSKINLLNVKIKDKDTVFLKSIGIKYPKKLREIEIEAIVDPYAFVKNNESNMKMLEMIAEDGSMEKVVKDEMTTMKYESHKINFTTRDKITRENMIDPIMNYLNDNSYFSVIQGKIITNLKNKIVYTEQTLNQVNAILDKYSSDSKGTNAAQFTYYNNENNQIDDILKTKSNLVDDLGYYKIELINTQQIIKELSVIANVQRETTIPIMLPTLFIGLYLFIVFFVKFYKIQKSRKINELNS
ncbi:hypothetical protein [Flavobacterium sp.]|jgi:hypothetical protein|uniref:hypothetical protein n=1 Tax=Flavobacterium sp. TaxID=239 RepID=UPI0037C13B34